MPDDRIFLSAPDVGPLERAYVDEAFDGNWLSPLGPHVGLFEQELAAACGVNGAAAVASGTAAMHLALLLAGIGPGDQVFCPTLTFVATANPVVYIGARPTFVDSDEGTWTIDADLLEDELAARATAGSLLKAVVTVHLYGQCADYPRIEELTARYGLVLIEDAAEALGSTAFGRPAGSFGSFSVLSINGNKIITTSGGGALLGNGEGDMARARFLSSQAREAAMHYEHREVGFNYRISNVAAAIGRGQLASLDDRVSARRSVFDRYQQVLGDLPGLAFMPEAPYGTMNRWLTALTIDPAAAGISRDDVIFALEARNIEARPVWKPMHLQPLYADATRIGGDTAARLFGHGLCLPSGSSLTDAQVDKVADIVRATFRN